MASDPKTAIVPPKRANTDYPVGSSLPHVLVQLTLLESAYRFRPVWAALVPISTSEPNAHNYF